MQNGTQLIYLAEDAGRVTDTGVFLAPGEENAVEVGIHLNAELAEAFVLRGICGVYQPDPPKARRNETPEMPWLNPVDKPQSDKPLSDQSNTPAL